MLAWPRWTTRINQHFPLRYLTWLLCGALALFFALTWTAGLTGGVLVLVFLALLAIAIPSTAVWAGYKNLDATSAASR